MGRRALAGAVGWAVGCASLVVGLVTGAAPAAAKGPIAVTVATPGGEEVDLGAAPGQSADRRNVLLNDLADDLGLWASTGDGSELMPEPPDVADDHLGPGFDVRWSL
ncbi:MAG TPA: hypothetical protein VFI47_04100, partial [Acidimicrobiales bacterium]|nr:hypothetical protein [Acidimicrobiales bacterium]